jgi:hypothetical protein
LTPTAVLAAPAADRRPIARLLRRVAGWCALVGYVPVGGEARPDRSTVMPIDDDDVLAVLIDPWGVSLLMHQKY